MDHKSYLYLVLIITSFRGYKFDCKITDEQLDECMLDTMFFGSERSIVPANDDQMTAHCDQTQKGIACQKEYSETCLKGFPKQITSIILSSVAQHVDKRCNNAKERAEFIENAKCFLPKDKMKPLNICSDKHTRYLEISSTMGKDDHIAGTCCGYFIFKDCIVTETKKLCGDGHSQYWDEIFDEVSSEAVTFACGDHDSKDQCSKLLKPEQWEQFKKIDEATDPALWAHNYKTPIKFMLDMAKKFHSDR